MPVDYGAVVLFVTADAPLKLLNELLKLGYDEEYKTSCFSLMRTPSQQELRERDGTIAPVEQFTSGFQGWTISQLGDFIHQQRDALLAKDRNANVWELEYFAVLDERTVKDRTFNVAHFSMWRRDPEVFESDEREWMTVRLPMDEKVCESVVAATMKNVMFFGAESLDLIDEEGVWRISQQ